MFVDESGFSLTPFVANTWSPVGQTPRLVHAMGHWEKVNAISGVAVRVGKRRLDAELFFRLHKGRSVGSRDVAGFLRQLARQLNGPVFVVWDNAPQHRGPFVRRFRDRHARFEIVYLPPYCPELNPDENVWAWTKSKDLANTSTVTNRDLLRRVRGSLRRMQRRPHLVRGCLRSSSIPWGDLLNQSGGR